MDGKRLLEEFYLFMMVELAYKIIFEAFAGKFDKADEPYIFHLERVAAPFRDDQFLFVAALLHDLVEDCPEWNFDKLTEVGFHRRIVLAVEALTKQGDEDYQSFIHRVSENEDARKIKISDLKDNMNLTRLKRKLTKSDLKRVEKYHKAYLLLSRF
jgi:(p)ppGpp synthase/HD superfamily hydrolase